MDEAIDDPAHLRDNHVELTGRLVHDPTTHVLPSGDEVTVLRVSVPRARGQRTGRGAGRGGAADWIDCALWTARLRRSAQGWGAGDWVRASGEFRRRSFVTANGRRSVLEVEATTARRVWRIDRGQSTGAASERPSPGRGP